MTAACAIQKHILTRWVRSQICNVLAGPEVTEDGAVEASKASWRGLQALALPAMALGTGERLQGPSMSERAVEMVGYLLGNIEVNSLQRVSPLTDCQNLPLTARSLGRQLGSTAAKSLQDMSLRLIAFSVSSSCDF